MKKILGLFMLFAVVGILCIGCTEAEKKKVADITEKTVKTVEVVADVAAASGVPFAGAVGAVVPFIGTTILALLGMNREKKKTSALYQSTADLHTKSNEIATGLKDKTFSVEDVVKMLPSMVKDVSTVAHSAYGVYHIIEKDVNKHQNKGLVKKLT